MASRPNRLVLALLLLSGLFARVATSTQSNSQDPNEALVEAAFTYNFCLFIDWPSDVFKGKSDPLIIGVAGRDSFVDPMREAVRSKTVYGRQVEVRRIHSIAEAKRTHVVFLGFREPKKSDEYLAALRQLPVVTIGDDARFNAMGGMIGFFRDGERVHYEINLEAVKAGRLGIQARLLTLAKITPARD